jgi:pilus assembly protein CpaF
MNTPLWLSHALSNSKITDLCINGSKRVFMDEGDGLQEVLIPCDQQFKEDQLRDWVLHELSQIGKTWDAKFPFVDGTIRTSHRIHIVFPPLSENGILISLRRLPKSFSQQEGSSPSGRGRWKSSALYSQVADFAKCGDSILISGATGSGKTTLASDLLEEVGQNERIIALEDTPELAPKHPHFLSLVSRPANADGHGEITLRTLLKQTLRMRPDRIVLGECRGTEVLELLQALNTGHRGALATLHANSPRDALRRIELLCLLSTGGAISSSGVRELLSLGIQWVIQVKRIGPERKITECWRIEGREGDTILMRQMLG